jgi:N-acetylglucosaminyl-diphospho-decaprenol L-rhamnosyltransferase
MAGVEPQLSIVIVLHNSADELVDCLRSVGSAIEPGWAELIAVDNASPDRSAEIVRGELPEARFFILDQNRGFAAGANAALSKAVGRYWLLLNPDVVAPTSGLETLVDWMDAHPAIAAASPELCGDDGRCESPGRATPSILRTLLELSRVHRLTPAATRARVLRGPYWLGGDQCDAGWVPGAAMIVRPEAARQVGLLREDLFMYGEDIEWCWRLRRAGWRIGVCSAVTFVHRGSSSARRTWSEREQERRIAAGVDAACRSMYGEAHARALAALTGLALRLDSYGTRRDPARRVRARDGARVWAQLARRR